MSEHASDAPLQRQTEPTRRQQRRTASAALAAPPRADATPTRPGAHRPPDAAPSETAVDRYAFYLFMGTVTLGVLAMIVMAFAI
jgi:hypothetical protein